MNQFLPWHKLLMRDNHRIECGQEEQVWTYFGRTYKDDRNLVDHLFVALWL